MVKELNSQIKETLSLMGIKSYKHFPRVIIVSEQEIGANIVGNYFAFGNTLYINQGLLRKGGLTELFKKESNPVSTHRLSSMVHELYHWRDACDLREKYGIFNSQEEYMTKIKEVSKLKVAKLISQGYNVDKISYYSQIMKTMERYDEVYTEYRTKVLLEGKDTVDKLLRS